MSESVKCSNCNGEGHVNTHCPDLWEPLREGFLTSAPADSALVLSHFMKEGFRGGGGGGHSHEEEDTVNKKVELCWVNREPVACPDVRFVSTNLQYRLARQSWAADTNFICCV